MGLTQRSFSDGGVQESCLLKGFGSETSVLVWEVLVAALCRQKALPVGVGLLGPASSQPQSGRAAGPSGAPCALGAAAPGPSRGLCPVALGFPCLGVLCRPCGDVGEGPGGTAGSCCMALSRGCRGAVCPHSSVGCGRQLPARAGPLRAPAGPSSSRPLAEGSAWRRSCGSGRSAVGSPAGTVLCCWEVSWRGLFRRWFPPCKCCQKGISVGPEIWWRRTPVGIGAGADVHCGQLSSAWKTALHCCASCGSLLSLSE